MRTILTLFSLALVLFTPSLVVAKTLNGFSLENATVPLNLVQSGGPLETVSLHLPTQNSNQAVKLRV
ncbi:hypothetical protein JCM19239_6543 [Vibrio variabilis]|uniref:Uncharacterized protein n=1 Tax=Vibrio variabilis TaxID=990271 RepID=A0ABQ0JRT0_9VIBR|nr:hypothetical protein JCM19239_6543 [Vibrio variabilis]